MLLEGKMSNRANAVTFRSGARAMQEFSNDSQRSAQQNQNKITFVANGDCKFHALLVGWNIFSLERESRLSPFRWNEDRDRAPLPNLWTSPLPIRTWFSGQRKTKFPDSTEPAPWQDVHNLREGTPTNRFTNVFCGLLLSKKQAVGQSPSWNEPLDPAQGFQELHLAALGTLLEASSEVSVAPEAKLSHFLHALGSQTLDFESILGTRVWGVEWPGALTWWSIHVMGGRRRIRIRAVVVIVVFILGHCRGGRR
mmetsp:Transcript_15229/g.42146  ORF Transcript_15229/g.42146 Transcript_15229/m.42146 type:complete len:253 (-) Transcript_15229:131-889(-)